MNIINAVQDENLFRPFMGADLDTWRNWLIALRALYGIKIKPTPYATDLIHQCTGRDLDLLPADGFNTALFLIGRRSGKSKTSAIVGAFEAALSGREKLLSKGEKGLVIICAPSKKQAQIVKNYIRAIFETDLLKNEVVNETVEGFELSNGVEIMILAGDFRTIRGFTLLAAVVDEICFFGYDAECKIKSDTELIRAIKPALATVNGKLVCISSPYAKKGWSYRQYQRCFGNDLGKILVWNSPSMTMNPTLPQSVVDEAMEEDLQAAKSEYLGEFRDDVCEFIPRSLIESLVISGRKELLPKSGIQYFGFTDVSGGRGDDSTLAIAHKSERKTVLDFLKRYRPPFSPQAVIVAMSEELKRYGLKMVTGDNYAAEYTSQAFESQGIHYKKSEKPKSQLYLEFLPRACSGEIELLDDEVMIGQMANLERRTRSGGKDTIDHPPQAHDDLANAVAGVCEVVGTKKRIVGGWGSPYRSFDID